MMSRLVFTFTLAIVTTLPLVVWGQVEKDTSTIEIEIDISIGEPDDTANPPIWDAYRRRGYYTENFGRLKKLEKRAAYVILSDKKTQKYGVMSTRTYRSLVKRRKLPKDTDFILVPTYDQVRIDSKGLVVVKKDDDQYLLRKDFKPLLADRVLKYEAERSHDEEVSLVKLKTDEGWSVWNVAGNRVTDRNLSGLQLRGKFAVGVHEDSVYAFNQHGQLVMKPFKRVKYYASLHGAITLYPKSNQIVYYDMEAQDTIAVTRNGIAHRGNFTAIQEGVYWQIIDRKGQPVSLPAQELLQVKFYNMHRVALLTFPNPAFEPKNPQKENRFRYYLIDLHDGRQGFIKMNLEEFPHYRLYSGQHFLGTNWLLGGNVVEVPHNSGLLKAAHPTPFKVLVTLKVRFSPKRVNIIMSAPLLANGLPKSPI